MAVTPSVAEPCLTHAVEAVEASDGHGALGGALKQGDYAPRNSCSVALHALWLTFTLEQLRSIGVAARQLRPFQRNRESCGLICTACTSRRQALPGISPPPSAADGNHCPSPGDGGKTRLLDPNSAARWIRVTPPLKARPHSLASPPFSRIRRGPNAVDSRAARSMGQRARGRRVRTDPLHGDRVA